MLMSPPPTVPSPGQNPFAINNQHVTPYTVPGLQGLTAQGYAAPSSAVAPGAALGQQAHMMLRALQQRGGARISLQGPAPGTVDPTVQGTTQTGYNTAAQQQNNYNSYNPYGETTYGVPQIVGYGPGGVPIYQNIATQTLSPQQQRLLNTLQRTQATAGSQAGGLLSGANYGSETPAQAIGNMTTGLTGAATAQEVNYLKPYFQWQTQQADTALRNMGFDPLSPAYQQQMMNVANQQGNQVESFIAQTQPQLMQQATTEYTLPMSLASSLASLGQPNTGAAFNAVTGAQTSPPNYISAVASNQEAIQEQQIQNQLIGQLLGGAISGGSSVLSGYLNPASKLFPSLSDIRLKRDVVPAGKYGDHQLYRFRYLDHEDEYLGVMAHEVLDIDPEAVHKGKDGYLRVDYARIGVPFVRLSRHG